MKIKIKVLLLLGFLVACYDLSTQSLKADQPQSTIDSNIGVFYTPYQSETPLGLSTSQTPTPDCPDDVPEDPDYYWDFGPLDGTDNGDGTATIATDVSGYYDITVYCEQSFIDSNGNEYTNDTQTSD